MASGRDGDQLEIKMGSHMKSQRFFGGIAAGVLALSAAAPAHALTINLIDTGGVSQGTAAYDGFRAAADFWESVLLDDIVVTFRVGFTTEGFEPTTLGSASSSSALITKGNWANAITADATTALDASVIANLPNVGANNVRLNSATLRALGFDVTPTANGGTDATIRFNSARPFDFDTRDGFQGVASDFVSVAVHEMGHALGFTSAVGRNTNNNSTPSNTDLFRYKNGQWDITWGGDPYFSIDGGATEYLGNAGFSAGPDGFQTSHWREGARIHDGVNCTVLLEAQVGIHDPTGGLCQQGIVTAQDLAIFDAMGWDLRLDILQYPGFAWNSAQILDAYFGNGGIPEPTTWAMMIGGFGLVGGALRRRRSVQVTYA